MNFPIAARVLLVACTLSLIHTARAQTVEWWDPAGYSYPGSYTAASGITQVKATEFGVYSVGRTDCTLVNPNVPTILNCHGLLLKYDTDGNVVWRKIISNRDDTRISAIAVDETGVYIHGTDKWFEVRRHEESFVQRYTHDGDRVWTFRDSEGNPRHYRLVNAKAQALILYDGYLYASSRREYYRRSGQLYGNFLRKFSLDGQLEWLVESPSGSLAAGDGKIFSSQSDWVEIFDTDGNLLANFRTPELIAENGLAYHDGALYYCSLGPARQGRRVPYGLRKMWLDGTPAWQIDWGRTDFPYAEGCSVEVDDGGVTFAGNLRLGHRDTFDANLTIRRYSLYGEELSRIDFPSLVAVPNSLSVLGDEIYLAGWDLESGKGFTGRVSDAPTLPPTMAVLNSPEPGAPARLALLDHHYGAGPVSAVTQDLPASDTGDLVQFSADLRPVDFLGMPDMNGNGHDELVVLSKRPAVAEIVDSHSGILLLHVDLDKDFDPIAAAITDDGVLAVLSKHPGKNYERVEEFDIATGARLGETPFNPNYTPLDLFALSDSSRRYAVLGEDAVGDGQPKLEIRDSGGTLVKNLWLGRSMKPLRALAYYDGGLQRIALLRQRKDVGWTELAIVDPETGVVDTLPRNRQFSPGPMAFSPDIDMNLAGQFTFAGQNELGKVRAETRDLGTEALLHNVYLQPFEPIQDLVYLAPKSGVATPSLALLVRDDFEVIPSRYRVIMVDLLTGVRTNEWYFGF